MPPPLGALPPTFAATREGLRALACYVVAPARKARTGRIGLRPHGDGFATPPLPDGRRLAVTGDELRWEPGEVATITTLRAAAVFAGVELSDDPGVGDDLPPFAPDDDLAIDSEASLALGRWYAFGEAVLDRLRGAGAAATISEAQLWPEHFDVAVTAQLPTGAGVNVGCSPGDDFHTEPYVYVGPHDRTALTDEYRNAPFGAVLPYGQLAASSAPVDTAMDFVVTGLGRLGDSGR